MRTACRLALVLAVFAAGAAVLHLAPSVRSAVEPVSLYGLPTSLGAWSSVEGAPEEALPTDPAEKLAVRRTYRNGDQVAWVSVALFTGQNDEARRPSINKIHSQRAVSLVEPLAVTASLNGPASPPVALPAKAIHQGSQELVLVYWHQIGRRTFGSEYRFRLALSRQILFARAADSVLVRIAVPGGNAPAQARALDTASTLAPLLYSAVNDSLAAWAEGKR
jgi:EpsI family protein